MKLLLQCGGCDATAIVGPLWRRFHEVSPNFGLWKTQPPESLTPDGWVMFDPYTAATYCPKCWAGIEAS